MARLKSVVKKGCKCREAISDILRKRIKNLEDEIDAKDLNFMNGNGTSSMELRIKKQESQLILNTVLLMDL